MASKAPPKFAKNDWAWAYTLGKLRNQNLLNADGDPDGSRGYAAANRIYHNVIRKYGAEEPALPAAFAESRDVKGMTDVDRADLIDMDIGNWIVSRGILWAANDDRQQRLFMQHAVTGGNTGQPKPNMIVQPLCVWRIEVRASPHEHNQRSIPDTSALWLVRDSHQASEFVRGEMLKAIGFLRAHRDQLEAQQREFMDGKDPYVTVTTHAGENPPRGVQKAQLVDFGSTLSLFSRDIAELERSLAKSKR